MDNQSRKSKHKFQQTRSYQQYKGFKGRSGMEDEAEGSVSLDTAKKEDSGVARSEVEDMAGFAHNAAEDVSELADNALEKEAAEDGSVLTLTDMAGMSNTAIDGENVQAQKIDANTSVLDPNTTMNIRTAEMGAAASRTSGAVEQPSPETLSIVIDKSSASTPQNIVHTGYTATMDGNGLQAEPATGISDNILQASASSSAIAGSNAIDLSEGRAIELANDRAINLDNDGAAGSDNSRICELDNNAAEESSLGNTTSLESFASRSDGQPGNAVESLQEDSSIPNKNHTSVHSSEYEEIIYSYDVMRKIDLSESSESSSGSFGPTILLDRGFMMDSLFLHKLGRVVVFRHRSKERASADGSEVEQPLRKRGRKKQDRTGVKYDAKIKKSDVIHGTACDPRYLHFLKKVCSMGKADAVKYIKSQQKWLGDRYRRNKADIPGKHTYEYEIVDSVMHIRSAEDDSAKLENRPKGRPSRASLPMNVGSSSSIEVRSIDQRPAATNLRILAGIRECECPRFNMSEFEYIVYKFGDDFNRLSQSLGLGIRDSILAYYLHGNRKQHIGHSLLETIVRKDWAVETDKQLFVQNFKRHGRKFWKYQIHRSEKDVKLFYKYYVKKGLPGFWTEEERAEFSRAFKEHRKDWGRLSAVLPGKSIQELKIYYNEYFKKLPCRERESGTEMDEDEVVREIVNVTNSIQLGSNNESGQEE